VVTFGVRKCHLFKNLFFRIPILGADGRRERPNHIRIDMGTLFLEVTRSALGLIIEQVQKYLDTAAV
jgi:hypothetical protein